MSKYYAIQRNWGHTAKIAFCLIETGQGCHRISHCFLLTEAKSEKLTSETSGLAIKGRLTTCKFVTQTGDMDIKMGHVKHTAGKKLKLIIHTKSTKLVIILTEK